MSLLALRGLHDSSVCLTQRRRLLDVCLSFTPSNSAIGQSSSFATSSASLNASSPTSAKSPRPKKRRYHRRFVTPERLIPLESNTITPNKLEQHLRQFDDTTHELLLEDLERHRPPKPANPRLPTYDLEYKKLEKVVMHSFSSSQLQDFVAMYGLDVPKRQGKPKHRSMEKILEHWGWIPITDARQERALWKETGVEDYPMSPGSAFLFMGKDGEDLLSLAQRYSVHLSFNPDPLSLRIQGLKGAINQVNGYMKIFDQDIASETIQLPLGLTVSEEMVRELSRMSGAYAEVQKEGQILATYRKSKPQTVETLTRLAVQAAIQAGTPTTCHLELPSRSSESKLDESLLCSFYPFFPSQTSSSKVESTSPFRLRRVGQWLRTGSQFSAKEDSLSQSSNLDIRRLIHEKLGKAAEDAVRTVTASTGHVLFLSDTGKSTLVPPVSGRHGPQAALELAKERPERVVFNAGVPKKVMMTWPHNERKLQRLVYKAHSVTGEKSEDRLHRTLTVELFERPAQSLTDGPEVSADDVRCKRSVETTIDVLHPSRATDVRISAEDIESLPLSTMPSALQDYVARTSDTACIPLVLDLEGQQYVLASSDHIRQGYQRHLIPKVHSHNSEGPRDIECIVEAVFGAENGLNVTECKLQCQDSTSDEGWKLFLEKCDFLTSIDVQPTPGHSLDTFEPWVDEIKSPRATKGDAALEKVFEIPASEFDTIDDVETTPLGAEEPSLTVMKAAI